MAVDPAFFEEFEPLPDKGQHIRARLRDGQVIHGTVELIWACMDTAAVKLRIDGTSSELQVILGVSADEHDWWEPLDNWPNRSHP